jgi:hypothetical protein
VNEHRRANDQYGGEPEIVERASDTLHFSLECESYRLGVHRHGHRRILQLPGRDGKGGR